LKTLRLLATAGVAALAFASAAAPADAARGLEDPIKAPIPKGPLTIGLQTIATGLVAPTSGTFAPGVNNRLYVTDQVGRIWTIDLRTHRKFRFADLTDRIVPLGNIIPGLPYDERGLLGLAFSPNYRENGLLYTYQTERVIRPGDFTTQPGKGSPCAAYGPPFVPHPCQNVVTEWRVRNPKNPAATVDPGSRRELMRIDKPQFNHNGGELAFGPDGLLYISTGDGGFADDQGPGHVPGGNAQSLAPLNVLGKILRIDPRGHNSANGRYGIPRDNPFVGRRGADEIFAYGFRNPYRMSFDATTGRLIVADVGQNDIEEVDLVRAGGNYGWRIKEGTFLFDPGSPTKSDDGVVTANSEGRPRGLIDPIAEYDHTAPSGELEQGEAIVGGFVYHGKRVPKLSGVYVFGDYSQEFAQPLGRLWFLNHNNDPRHRVSEFRIAGQSSLGLAVLGFGRDAQNEIYVLGSRTGVVSGHTGVVQMITNG
jgi:glucose/arabinose dehydrogenase